ncbi:alpha/beta hydrolase family protein [Polaribacter marinivivus]|uniref:alpha/beta hydrolase family protein n=1 Tax=Polaribacter marinivivus TaxID=1524260 RepID=UPI003D3489C7
MIFFEADKFNSSLQVPKFVSLFFKIIQHISSKLTIILASKIFVTPIKFKTPKREIGMLNTSQKSKLFVSKIHKEIEVLSYGFSNKKVLLAHGWAGRSTQLFMIANTLLEKGFMVISFDMPAHGESSGKKTNLLEYIETIKALHNNYGPFCAAVGHSFGGMALMNTQKEETIFNCLITVGSGDKTSTILNNFSNNLGLQNKFGKKLRTYFEQKWNQNVDNFATSNVAENVTIPVLIVHDVNDGDVDVSCGINIRQNLSNGKLLITKGLGHTKILRNKKITNRIVKFIIENS